MTIKKIMHRANCLVICLFLCNMLFSQGRYTTSYKKLIGTSFTDDHHIKGLAGYSYREGTMLGTINDPVLFYLNVYWKGQNAVVIFSQQEDTAKRVFAILDVIELKNIPKGFDIKTVGCQYGDTEGDILVALVKPGKGEYVSLVKQAWFCNRDRIRVEAVSASRVKCLNEGDD